MFGKQRTLGKEDPEGFTRQDVKLDLDLIDTINESFSFCNKLNKTCTSNKDCSNGSLHNCSICWTDNANRNKQKICGPPITLSDDDNQGIVMNLFEVYNWI